MKRFRIVEHNNKFYVEGFKEKESQFRLFRKPKEIVVNKWVPLDFDGNEWKSQSYIFSLDPIRKKATFYKYNVAKSFIDSQNTIPKVVYEDSPKEGLKNADEGK